jgi:alpha-beta hydrolase superfamily lysophospholipase
LLLAGFLQQFAAVIDDSRPHLHLAHTLRQLSGGRTPDRVICTGHSLGGALATLGALWKLPALEGLPAQTRRLLSRSPSE